LAARKVLASAEAPVETPSFRREPKRRHLQYHRQDDSVIIRLATAADAAPLATLLEELGFPAPAEVVITRLRDLAIRGERVLVAEVEQTVKGFVSVHVTPVLHRPTPVGRLTALVVKASSRGMGIGRALVEAAERDLRGRGCGLIEVTSHRSLESAHGFYQRLGYEITSYRFRKKLAAPRAVAL
jgi:ribosomal protein S18 acetylase RimI-like enzyme